MTARAYGGVDGLMDRAVMGKPRGQRTPQRIVGDPEDRFAFPMMVDAYTADRAVRGYSGTSASSVVIWLRAPDGWQPKGSPIRPM